MSCVVPKPVLSDRGACRPGRAACLFSLLWPALSVAGQPAHLFPLEPVVLLLSPTERAAPCGWSIIEDRTHPERPRHIIPAVSADRPESCALAVASPSVRKAPGGIASGGIAPVRAAATLSMVWATAGSRLVLRVTALEDGRTGAVIRCRSSFAGSILLGRVLDAKTVEWVGEAGGDRW